LWASLFAASAWVYAALVGNGPLAMKIFLAAWVLAVGAMVARTLLQKNEESIMAAPMKVGVIGFSGMASPFLYGLVSGHS